MRLLPPARTHLTCLLGLLALASPASAYRTVGDLPEFAGTGPVRWQTDRIPVVLHPGFPAYLDAPSVEAAVAAGLGIWGSPECNTLDLAYEGVSTASATGTEARVSIQWVGAWAELGFSVDIVGTTDSLYVRGSDGAWSIADADILLNGESATWATLAVDSGDARDVQAVIAHESGHCAGLSHVCERGGLEGAPNCRDDATFAERVMYPGYVGVSQRALSADDEAGICFLYGELTCVDLGCPAGMECVGTSCRALCDASMCAEDEFCGETGCELFCPLGVCDPCDRGACESGLGDLGDPCTDPAACASGHCGPAGYCSLPCSAARSCPSDWFCGDFSGELSCVASGGVLGTECSAPTQCTSGLCLLLEGQGHCTRTCDSGPASCPSGYGCSVVDARSVCARISSGCSITHSGSSTPPATLLLLLAMFALRFKRFRR
ncbi:MAG: M10 family metallopeptidase domain-containing protein [Myxococcales bacterium]|nr:M10 family metallopeptidase domain-containing protein [Myxococcales bacterium]